jgi:hypothetical protein
MLGKNIDEICLNRFHDPKANHCAHFVSHAMALTFSFHCRQLVGGTKPGANVRVHEVFAQCPRVGRWDEADAATNQLVFVTRKDIVNLATKTMQNIPQKHIGIYSQGLIYHYSNGEDRVVKQTPDEFLQRFQTIYDGDQGLFFGEFPQSELELTVDRTGANVPSGVAAFKLQQDGKRWMAERTDIPHSPAFLAGVEVRQPAKNFFGLFFPQSSYYGRTYDARFYEPTIHQWAYLIDLTASCESQNHFNLINTYDRARFTYGFYQLAAHTPRDNLILLFREALLDPGFQKLFPDLRLIGGRVFRAAADGTATDLEAEVFDPATGEHQLKNFMAYLNPERTLIDEQEVLQCARTVWWANETQPGVDLQVKVANHLLQRKFSERYAEWYDLDGQLDTVCAIIADIHHQGRGTKKAVRAALSAPNQQEALLEIGSDKYPERIATLSARIQKWKDAGAMGRKTFNPALNEFMDS